MPDGPKKFAAVIAAASADAGRPPRNQRHRLACLSCAASAERATKRSPAAPTKIAAPCELVDLARGHQLVAAHLSHMRKVGLGQPVEAFQRPVLARTDGQYSLTIRTSRFDPARAVTLATPRRSGGLRSDLLTRTVHERDPSRANSAETAAGSASCVTPVRGLVGDMGVGEMLAAPGS